MLRVKFRNYFKSTCLSQVKSRNFTTESAIAQEKTSLVGVNGYFINRNDKKETKVQKFVGGPIFTAVGNRFLTPNSQCRHFSGMETLDNVSKYSQYSPIYLFQDFALWIHSTTNLPWWASIILYTAILRISFSLSLSIYQEHLSHRLTNVNSELIGHQWRLKKNMEKRAIENNWSESEEKQEYNKAIRQERQNLYIRDNCHPLKMFTILLMQMGLFLCQTIAIRNLCLMLPVPDGLAAITKTELTLGGLGWFQDLSVPDQYFILPVLSSLLVFINVKTARLLYPTDSAGFLAKIRKSMVIILPAFSLFFSSLMPTAVVLSWMASTVVNYTQLILFALPKVRRILGLPKSAKEIDQPILKIYKSLRRRDPYEPVLRKKF